MKLQKTTVNHVMVMSLFIAGMFAAIVGSGILFRVILPGVYREAILLAQFFIGVAWLCAWVLRGIYKSNRDLAYSDMGRITLVTFIAEMHQVYTNKYGALTQEALDEAHSWKGQK
jgi:hypothetical protein